MEIKSREQLNCELDDLLQGCEVWVRDSVIEVVKDFVDYCEKGFNEIKEELSIDSIPELHKIEDAFLIAEEMSQKLY